MNAAPITIPDLLFAAAELRVDTRLLERALDFGFSAGDTDRAFEKAIETARCPPSPFSEPSFSRDLFVAEFVELCLKIRVGNKNYTPCKPYLRRILCNPSAGLNDVYLRQGVFHALERQPELREGMEQAYVHLISLRETLSSGDFSSRLDQNQRRLEILRALTLIFRHLSTAFPSGSALARVSAYAREVCGSDGFAFVEELLHYERSQADVDVRLQMGTDGSIRGFHIVRTVEYTESPLYRSWIARVWRRLQLWAKGYRVTENEVISQLIFRAFEGIKSYVPPLFQLVGDLEFYLGGLGFRDLCAAAGYPTSLASFVGHEHSKPHATTETGVDSSVRFIGLYNPFLVSEGVAARPCDVEAPAQSIVILTGPNSGGKTRLMQSIALCQLIGQAGMPVAAKQAVLQHTSGLFVSMLEDVRADQPEGRLGMELLRIRRLFEHLNAGDVVVLDELCSGTNPSEGEEIFLLVIELLAMLRPQVWLSTHFLQLAHRLQDESLAGKHPYLRFLQVVLDGEDHPTYQFKPGVANTSLARQTAARLGVTRSELLNLVRRSLTLPAPNDTTPSSDTANAATEFNPRAAPAALVDQSS